MTPRETDKKGREAMGKTKVRTTIEPGRVIEVDDAELLDLDRQGLLKSYEGGKGWKPEETDTDTKKES
jgi:hypothetical protein